MHGLAALDRPGDRRDILAGERPLAGERLPRSDAERELIGTRVGGHAADLLRRHVGRRAEQRAGARQIAVERALAAGGRVARMRRGDVHGRARLGGGGLLEREGERCERRLCGGLRERIDQTSARARPKSVTSTRPARSTSTLSGLKSRWTMPAACAAASPRPAARTRPMISILACARPRATPPCSRPRRAPSRRGRARAIVSRVEHRDHVRVAQLRHRARLAQQPGLRGRRRRRAPGAGPSSATLRSSSVSCASHTTPMPPAPSSRSSRYLPICSPAFMPRAPSYHPRAEGPSRAGSRRRRAPTSWPGPRRCRARRAARATDGAAAGVREVRELLAERREVVREARGLERRIEAAHQPRVLRRDAGRAVAGVAALRLDAADRQHRLARDVDHVAAERRARAARLSGNPSLPEPMNTTWWCTPALGERPVDLR